MTNAAAVIFRSPCGMSEEIFTKEVSDALKGVCDACEVHFIRIKTKEGHAHMLVQWMAAQEVYKACPRVRIEIICGGNI